MDLLPTLVPVYLAYVLATASPGPSNMAIMGTAMRHGRRPALAFAAGVVTGSASWALMAATGLSAVLASYAEAMTLIRIAGGLYLLFLAFKAGRAAISSHGGEPKDLVGSEPVRYRVLYRRGLLLHLMNPKAILAWISIMSLGLRPDMPANLLAAILIGCVGFGIVIFTSYAFVFSTPIAVKAYRRARRWIEGTIAVSFGYAGFYLLTSRS